MRFKKFAWEIRSITDNDPLETLVDVYRSAYRGLEDYAYTRTTDIRRYLRWLISRDKNGFFVAEANKQLIGFIGCDTNWISFFEFKRVCEIHEIAVLSEWQGRGVGRTLLFKALEYAKNRGRNLVELWVGIRNYRAIKFYEKMGFVRRNSWGKWLRMTKKI